MGMSGFFPQDNNTRNRFEFPKEPADDAERLCREFGHCPHDILEIIPDGRRCRIRQDGASRFVKKCCVCLTEKAIAWND